jgi:hypothetical protein
MNNKWEKQTRPLSWLVEKFMDFIPGAPLQGWSEENLKYIKDQGSKFYARKKELVPACD